MSFDELVFVVGGGEKAVKVFDLGGNPLYTLVGPGNEPGDLTNPTGIAVDRSVREVFVSDYGDPVTGVPASIRIYDYAGNQLAAISGDSGRIGVRVLPSPGHRCRRSGPFVSGR